LAAWPKTSAKLSSLLEEALAPYPAQKRMMFGGPAFFAKGNMFAGVHGEHLMLRLGQADREEFLSLPGAAPFGPMGRPMKEYMSVPESVLGDAAGLDGWLRRSFEYADSLPPRQPKPRKKSA
jgi:TfoX/Sxy family transcriptional regulator of competence genes